MGLLDNVLDWNSLSSIKMDSVLKDRIETFIISEYRDGLKGVFTEQPEPAFYKLTEDQLHDVNMCKETIDSLSGRIFDVCHSEDNNKMFDFGIIYSDLTECYSDMDSIIDEIRTL